jgi:NAD/NADP transhydrogenase beta subunit
MNRKMKDIMKLARAELIIIPVFILFKFIRPGVLKSESPEFFKIILLSLPNFFEAIIGALTLTGVILIIYDWLNKKYQIKPKIIYIIAVLLAGILVISQELNIITIRTNATMDQNDLIFSVIGLVVGYWFVLRIKQRII